MSLYRGLLLGGIKWDFRSLDHGSKVEIMPQFWRIKWKKNVENQKEP